MTQITLMSIDVTHVAPCARPQGAYTMNGEFVGKVDDAYDNLAGDPPR